ncbi:MAG: carboxypeptidase regulatory-like domain-containing protein [Planctomycetes bacterium]|nr:carboxypeptidase regulatory-like domain-containing protein [Planctomycetota bacterium]
MTTTNAATDGPHRGAAITATRRARWEIGAAIGLVIAACAAASPELRRWFLPPLDVVGHGGKPLRAALEFFAYDRAPSAPSPMPSLGRCDTGARGRARVDIELPDGGLVVRVSSSDCGIGYGFVEGDGHALRVELAPPHRVEGRVHSRDGRALADARVQVFGGGPRGVLLVETRTDATGSFVVDSISSKLTAWTVRAFADGHAIGSVTWECDDDLGPSVVLDPTKPLRGRIVAQESIPLDGLELRVLNLPGVVARVAADGSFELAQLPPPPTTAYSVVAGLPPGWTFERTALVAGSDVTIRLVREERVQGRVVDAASGAPVAGARVFHEHGPMCVAATRSEADGSFELGLVPPGRIVLRAVLERRPVPGERMVLPGLAQAVETVEVGNGSPPQPVLLRIE